MSDVVSRGERAMPDPTRARWGAGSIISIVLALLVFVVLAIWLSAWWLVLPIGIFVALWFVNDRARLLRAVRAEPADPQRHSALIGDVVTASREMGIQSPALYVSPQPVRNAWSLTDRNGGVVCVFQGAIDALDEGEIAAVIAHEVGHLKNRDTLYMTLFESLRISLTVVFIFIAVICAIAMAFLTRGRSGAMAGLFGAGIVLVGAAASFILITAGQRSREYEADRLASATHSDPLALGRALKKFEAGDQRWELGDVPISVAARCIVAPFTNSFMSGLVSSHPSTDRRIARIERQLGPERVAALERSAVAAQRDAVAQQRRRTLEQARHATPHPLPAMSPFTATSDERLWISCAAKRVSAKSIHGQPGFQVEEGGQFFVTTERAVFASPTGRVEWRWSRLLDKTWMGAVESGEVLVLAVEDRRRNSGVWLDRAVAADVQTLLEVAVAEFRGERTALIALLESTAE